MSDPRDKDDDVKKNDDGKRDAGHHDLATADTQFPSADVEDNLVEDSLAEDSIAEDSIGDSQLFSTDIDDTHLLSDGALESAAAASSRTRMLPVDIGSQLGRYTIEDELGAGGMATVFAARDQKLRRQVAIKVLFPHLSRRKEVVARFHREARAAAALDHDNILRVFDVGGGEERTDEAGNRVIEPPYIVMELVRGRSLHEFLQDLEDPPLAEIVACVGAVMCAALAEAHAAGIVHRDVKPANIMVANDGRMALADFGVARIEDDESSLVTRAGALLGTPAFMSPEQAAGKPLDARSDIYSLGATLYRLATGHAPFTGPTARLVAAIARGEKRPPAMRNPALGSEMARVIERMMAPRVEERYASCADAGATLTEVARLGGVDDPEAELVDFFADPAGYRDAREPEVARLTLERARQAAREKSIPHALALSDRVLALVPAGSPEADAAMSLVEGIGRSRRHLYWLFLALALCGLAAALWVGWQRLGDNADAPPVLAAIDAGTPRDAPAIDASALPDAAVPTPVDAAPPRPDARGREPTGQNGTRRPRRVDAAPVLPVPIDASASPVDAHPAPAVDALSDTSIDAAPARAYITLAIKPWCDVTIDGKDYQRAKRGRVIELAPGEHEVICAQGKAGPRWQRRITLKPGERRDLSGSVHVPVRISVQVALGDRVTIDRQVYRNGDSLELAPGSYRVQVLKGSEDLGGHWLVIPPLGSCTIRDRPKLDCYP